MQRNNADYLSIIVESNYFKRWLNEKPYRNNVVVFRALSIAAEVEPERRNRERLNPLSIH